MAEPIPDFTDAESYTAYPALPERCTHVHLARQGETQPLSEGLSGVAVVGADGYQRVSA